MHRTARFFGGILLLAAILAVPTMIFLNFQKSRQTRFQLERRMAELESKLAQEIAVRQALAAGGEARGFSRPEIEAAAPPKSAWSPSVTPTAAPAATVEAERNWQLEMEKKDKQIAYLRSVVEKLASSPPATGAGSPQVVVETSPRPSQPFFGAVRPDTGLTSLQPTANPINQIMGEVSQAGAGDGLIFINRGERHGVVAGMAFEVYRKGQPVSRVRVANVYDRVSSVAVMDGFDLPETGDMIRSS